MNTVIAQAKNDIQTFTLVSDDFDCDGKTSYAIAYKGKYSNGYIMRTTDYIKTWKTLAGAMKAWNDLLIKKNAS